MLRSLSIRNVVLIERLELAFEPGLCVLTGETGAGKSILLDSLGLALGGRAEPGLVRAGQAQAVVAAAFEVGHNHPARAYLQEQGLDSDDDDVIVLRRQLSSDGRSRGFVNDTPSSARTMRAVAAFLIEVQGQFESHGLLDANVHREMLDAFGEAAPAAAVVASAHAALRAAEKHRDEIAAQARDLGAQREFLVHAVEEFDGLAPEDGEVARLADERNALVHQEQIITSLSEAMAMLDGDGDGAAGVADNARAALGRLDRAVALSGDRLRSVVEALELAVVHAEEAVAEIRTAGSALEAEPDRLAAVDDRLHALQGLARKHGVEADALPALGVRLRAELDDIENMDARVAAAAHAVEEARQAFDAACGVLSAQRATAAEALAEQINAELPALRLADAAFRVDLVLRAPEDWSQHGAETVAFVARTNPGSAFGPLHKVASGGELARFLLALKVVLAGGQAVPSLIFDEVDSGVGGATAAAVGERLARLANDVQMLVVTHSPQVAARGAHHWLVAKSANDGETVTAVRRLDDGERREEIARMLSAAEITDEARAAAERLLEPGRAA